MPLNHPLVSLTPTGSIIGSGFVYSAGAVLGAALFLFSAWRKRSLRQGLPLPPGPPGLPLIGNTLDINPAYPWLSYEQWREKYGNVVYIKMLGMDFIIINGAKEAHDLLDRRSNIYSDRPCIPATELFGLNFGSGLLPEGSLWRLHRKLFNISLSKDAVRQYKLVASRKACQLVRNLLDSPGNYAEHCKSFAGAVIMAVAYAYEAAPKNDPFVAKVYYIHSFIVKVLTPEWSALLLAFPFLSHIPSWLPGGIYKQRATECRALTTDILNTPVDYVKTEMAAGTARPSLVRDFLEEKYNEVDHDIMKAIAASTLLGGTDSTDSHLRVFLLAMVLHPEAQAKAQEEIDRVVGPERLPNFDDRPYLPYVEAVYIETFRWRPVLPTAIPHMTATSDVYEGMYIPKGAVVVPNVWAIGRDPTKFDDAMAFMPKRHLTLEGAISKDATHYTFGFGRRICPGRHLADQDTWMAIVTMLATLRVAKAHDKFGNEIDVKEEFTSGIVSSPKPFSCSITARSPHVKDLIQMGEEYE